MEKFLQNIKLLIVFLSFPFISNSQDLSNHHSYLNNFYNINPAYTGSQEDIEIVASYRSPWSGIKGINNDNIMAGVHAPFYTNEGIGVKMLSDVRGPFKTFIAEGQYAHQVNFKSDASLRFGLSAGVIQKRFDVTEEANNFVDFSDPSLNSAYYNQVNYRIGFGMLFRMKGLSLGVSAPNLVESNNPVSDFMVGTLSYKIKASESIAITPMVVYKRLPVSRDQADLLVRGSFLSEKIWVQAGYRTNQSYLAAIGFKLKHFSVGYGYELHKGYLEFLSRDMHEVVLSFSIGKRKAEENQSSHQGTLK